MEGCYFAGKSKRKDMDEVNDEFCDFSLSSPARKIRRLDAELPPIIEEDEMVNPMVFGSQDTFVDDLVTSPVTTDEISGVNEERAIILYDPVNNMPLLQTRSPFSVSVNSDFLSRFKNPVVWSSNHSNQLKSPNGKTEKHANNQNLAVVPWVPTHAQHGAMSAVEVPHTQSSEMMDEDDVMEATTMDIEDNNNSQEIPTNGVGSVNGSDGANHWQAHCVIPRANLSTPIAWSGV